MQALLFDLDGVLYQGDRLIDGALETLDWCRTERIPHLFVTNTTSRPRRALVKRLRGFGIAVTAEQIFTPPVAAMRHLSTHGGAPAALFVREQTLEDFEGLQRLDGHVDEGARSVVIGDIGEGWTFATLNRAFRLLMDEPSPVLIALGMSRYARGPGGLVLDVGPFVKALEYASGVAPVVMGKPAAEFFEAAVSELQAPREQTAMIGDDIFGDVDGAQKAGLVGVQVLTGKFRPRDLKGDVTPDAVLASVADLPAWWNAQ